MKRIAMLVALLALAGCSEDYANGERIGLVTQFSRAGAIWKSWEGHLNVTQTGMNSSVPFDFSIDNDKEDPATIAMLDSAANLGWKVKLTYHETFGKNWLMNRGETSHFITAVDVLDRNMANAFRPAQSGSAAPLATAGRTVDTVYVVIVGKASDRGR